MGSQLSTPIKSKLLDHYGNKKCRVGVADMQGYRLDMEDAHNVELQVENHPNLTYIGVFDGHGGSESALYAAEHCPTMLANLTNPTDPTQLKEALERLDQVFLKKTKFASGTTACLALIDHVTQPQQQQQPSSSKKKKKTTKAISSKKKQEKTIRIQAGSVAVVAQLTVASIGDSRCLVIDGLSGAVKFHTVDHKPSLPAELRRIKAAGGYVEQGRVDGNLAMSRALGNREFKSAPNLPALKQRVIPTPDVFQIPLIATDLVLVCCDGLVERLTNEQVAAFIHEALKKQPHQDVDLAAVMADLLNHSLEKGSKDNMSAVLYMPCEGVSYGKKESQFRMAVSSLIDTETVPIGSPAHLFKEAFIKDAAKHGFSEADVWAEVDIMKRKKKKQVPDHTEENANNRKRKQVMERVHTRVALTKPSATKQAYFASIDGDVDVDEERNRADDLKNMQEKNKIARAARNDPSSKKKKRENVSNSLTWRNQSNQSEHRLAGIANVRNIATRRNEQAAQEDVDTDADTESDTDTESDAESDTESDNEN